MSQRKRNYHPLVVFFFYAGMLDENTLHKIPYTTKKYWESFNHSDLYGFSWVEEFYSDHKNFQVLTKRKIVFHSAITCCRVLECFSKLFSQKRGYKSVLKKNRQLVVATIDYLFTKMPIKMACNVFRITTNQYYRWKNKIHCTASVLNLCYSSHPFQLSLKEVSVIRNAVNDPGNYNKPGATVYFGLLRENKLSCGKSSYYKYAWLTREFIKRLQQFQKPVSFRASKVFEYLHIDTTFFMTENGKRRVAFVKDNKSKAILHKAILPNGKSDFIRDLLDAAFEKFNLFEHPEPIYIVSDGGSENKGEVLTWVEEIKTVKVKKVIAGKDFPFSNAMSESTHHLFKTFFAPGKIYKDDDHLQQELNAFENFANYQWFPIELHGLHPMEIINGAVVDRGRFKEQINQAKKQRYLNNKNFTFCGVCKKNM